MSDLSRHDAFVQRIVGAASVLGLSADTEHSVPGGRVDVLIRESDEFDDVWRLVHYGSPLLVVEVKTNLHTTATREAAVSQARRYQKALGGVDAWAVAPACDVALVRGVTIAPVSTLYAYLRALATFGAPTQIKAVA